MVSVKRNFLVMSGITLIIGFMIAVQFQTLKEPTERDTRDTWELRQALLEEKEMELQLLSEIRANNTKLNDYETKTAESKEKILQDTLNELKAEAGLTEKTGEGLVLSIEPVNEELLLGEKRGYVTAELLQRLVNELHQYGAKEVAINDNRYINTSVIREINNVLKMDGMIINELPLEIKVLAKDKESSEKLYNYMKVSKSADEFFLSNLRLIVHVPNENITIPRFTNTITTNHLNSIIGDEGGGL